MCAPFAWKSERQARGRDAKKGSLVYPSFWPSFIEIVMMTCITPARPSHELSLNFANCGTSVAAHNKDCSICDD